MSLADWIILLVLLVSGLCALMRGIGREAGALIAWAGAVVATALLLPPLLRAVSGPKGTALMVDLGLAAILFIASLLFFSYLSRRLVGGWMDDEPGAIGRSLGFAFGLGRGFVMLAILYWFYAWTVEGEAEPSWVKSSKLMPLVQGLTPAIERAASLVGGEDTKPVHRPRTVEPRVDPKVAPKAAPKPAQKPDPQAEEADLGYQRSDRRAIEQLLETTREE
ncbi:MAG: CvpA family protein [Alphaproteobacteria bacterium]|nr:CvpA family protein [Alphaproteobacteria bacterium]